MTDRHPDDEPAATDASSQNHAASDSRAGFVVLFTPEAGPRRRITYEPRTDADGWWRITHQWTGCVWRIVGREPIVDAHCTAQSHV